MRKAKKIVSLVLTVALVLSVVGPFTGALSASAADGDDLTGWTLGATSQMSGNPTDGWKLDFTGLYFEDNGTSYTAKIDASKLMVNFNLSGLPMGKGFVLQLADQKGAFDHGLETSNTRVNFTMQRENGGLHIWEFGSKGSNDRTIADFDYDKDHVFGFAQVNGKWLPYLDGEILSGDDAANESYDTFVKTMSGQCDGKTTVSFSPITDDTIVTIKNISFSEKNTDDLTGWTPNGSEILSGNPDEGWQLTLGNTTGYSAAIDISKLKVSFDLSETGSGFIVGLGGEQKDFPAEGNILYFYFTKNDDSTWNVKTYKGGRGLEDKEIKNLDLNQTHAFGFVKAGDGWALSIDGKKVGETDAWYSELINNNMGSGKTEINFQKFVGSGTIKNINFAEMSGWVLGGASSLEGNSEDGWNLALQTGDDTVAYHANIDISKLQVGFNLSQFADGQWFVLGLGDKQEGFRDESNVNVRNILLQKKDSNSLGVQYFNGTTFLGEYSVSTDLNVSHTIGYKKIGNDWVVMIDDEKVIDGSDADNKFIEDMSAGSKEETKVTFVPHGGAVTIKNINFTERPIEVPSDLTGWTPGETSTLTGNPTDGWKLDFSGASSSENGTSYAADMDASRIQVRFNLSDLAGNIFLQLGNEKGDFYTGADTRTNFVLEKDGAALKIYGFDGNVEGTVFNFITIDNFEFEKDHIFEFVQQNGKWVPVLDGVVRCFDEWVEHYDTFVTNMIAQSPGKTIVSFAPNGPQTSIKNINFIRKTTDPTDADWAKMNGVTVTGDQNSGYGIQGNEYLTAYYRHPLKAADTTLSFRLPIQDGMWNTLALAEDMGMPLLPNAADMRNYSGMAFIFERKGADMGLQVWEGQYIYQLKLCKNFDFDGVHTLTFKNEHGNWYVVFDGEVIRSRQLNEVAGFMLAAEGGVHYRFSACYNDYSFDKIKFANTPQEKWEDSNWNVVGYEMSGSGDKLSFSGNGYASWKQQIDLKETSIEMQFKMPDDAWTGFTISDKPIVGDTDMPGLIVPEEPFEAISFILGRQNEKHLRISLYGTTPDGPAEKLLGLVRNFDFDAVHKLRIVEKNGRYYLALDGDIIEWPAHDGDDDYITNAITDLVKKHDNKVYFRFMNDQVYGAEWKQISFAKEEFTSPGIFTYGDITTSVNNNGLSASGAGLVGINSPFDVLKNKLRVQFKPDNENWVLLTIGDTPSAFVDPFWGPDNKHDMMCFILGRQNDNQLRLSMWDGEKEAMLVCLNHFDFNAAHTFSFVQHRGKYYLAIDDRMIEAVVMDGENEIVTSWITKAVKNLSKSTAYVRFMCEDSSAHMELSKIRWDGVKFSGVGTGVKTGVSFPVVPLALCVVVSAGGMLVAGKRIRKRRAGKN